MAANVALKPNPAGDLNSDDTSAPGDTRSSSQLSRLGNRFNRPEFRMRDNAPGGDSKSLDESDSEQLIEVERTDTSMERLTAALTDNAIQSQSSPQQSLTAMEARVRVDSLISRANQLLDVGQIEQARRSARLAQQLAESAHLDFSPDEDRPIDLVRRIEGQMETTGVSDEPRADSDTVASPALPSEPEASGILTKSNSQTVTPAKDESGLARIRRDWSALFRREKKQPNAETNSASLVSGMAKLGPVTDLHDSDQQANHTSEPAVREPIVMANRSVSLEPPEAITPSSATFTSALSDHVSTETDATRTLFPPPLDSENPDARNLHNESMAFMGRPSEPMTETDDTMIAHPEFDVVEAVVTSREIESKVEDQPMSEELESNETRQSDWIFLYMIFGVCSLMAFGCYHRGAT